MKNRYFKKQNILLVLCFLCFAFCTLDVYSQSINQNFPTSVASNEISGNIAARDVGDARLTSYFYAFSGTHGDVFINVLTKNLNGSIDVFTTENLRPLTKITVYANDAETETGRVIYLRKSEKLILRVEGRSPNDDAAEFRIKFAGSFQPLELSAENEAALAPKVTSENQSNIVVNSVGTIIEIKQPPKESEVKDEKEKAKIQELAENKDEIKESVTKKKIDSAVETPANSTPKVIVTEETAKEDAVEAEKTTVKNKVEKTNKLSAKSSIAKKTSDKVLTKTAPKIITEAKKDKNVKTTEPNPLENIRLIVLFKDGTKIEYPISQVNKVGVDKGVLTVNVKNGVLARYSILSVLKMTIE